jgi:hypothetical protein
MQDLSLLLDKISSHDKTVRYREELAQYKVIKAHRTYQYAMSRYKLLRYTPKNIRDGKDINWQIVDNELKDALKAYNNIRVPIDPEVTA